jgi:ABC-2 type transport system permease protein
MRNAWLIARAEYLHHVKRRSFVLAALGIPILIVAVLTVTFLVVEGRRDRRPVGLVDGAGIAAGLAPLAASQAVDSGVQLFPDEASAVAALLAGQTQGTYIIPPDYLQGGKVDVSYLRSVPGEQAASAVDRFLKSQLLAGRVSADARIATEGVTWYYRSRADGRVIDDNDFVVFLLPLLIGLFFVFMVMGSGSSLLQAVSTEKENRMVEVMFTSVSPLQLIGGKAAGLMAVAFTQLALWVAALVVAAAIGSRYADWLQGIEIPWALGALIALFFIPTYAVVAGLMIAIGAIFDEQQNAQQIAGLVNILFIAPLFFIIFGFTQPDGAILTAMTIFPTTSLLAIAIRWGFTTVPVWQIGLGLALLVGTAFASVWLASRIFRIGMLNYGQPMAPKSIAAAVKG